VITGRERFEAFERSRLVGEAMVPAPPRPKPLARPPDPMRRMKPGRRRGPQEFCVTRLWGTHAGEDAFVVGSGTSLQGFDFTRLADRLTIALNDAALAQGLDPAYHLWHDTQLWQRYRDVDLAPRTVVICSERGRESLVDHARCRYKDRIMWFDQSPAPDVDPRTAQLYVSRTIATAGIQLAWKLGAARVFLLGVDGYKLRGGAYYWTGARKPGDEPAHKGPARSRERDASEGRVVQDRHCAWRDEMLRLRKFLDKQRVFTGKWPGSGVYNLSRLSTIEAWEKVAVEEVLT
jgi:hypothetical protein